jgi:N-acetylmuramoyl-L-alanine amidase
MKRIAATSAPRPDGDSRRPIRRILVIALLVQAVSIAIFFADKPNKAGDAAAASDWRENASSSASRSNPSAAATPTVSSTVRGSGAFKVALDIGHLPKRGGAVSARGIFEYDFNHRLVAELSGHLQSSQSLQPIIINPQGTSISLPKRAEEAANKKADLFLAIHHDSVKDSFLKPWEFEGKSEKYCDDFHGYSLFISEKNMKAVDSLRFATLLGRALLNNGFTPTLHHETQEQRHVIDREKGIYEFDDLIVLKSAKMPAVLLECGVIVNRKEEENLDDATYRKRLIDAIIRGIETFARLPADASSKDPETRVP